MKDKFDGRFFVTDDNETEQRSDSMSQKDFIRKMFPDMAPKQPDTDAFKQSDSQDNKPQTLNFFSTAEFEAARRRQRLEAMGVHEPQIKDEHQTSMQPNEVEQQRMREQIDANRRKAAREAAIRFAMENIDNQHSEQNLPDNRPVAPEVNPAFSDRRSEQEQNRLDMSAREAAIRTAANAVAPEVKSYAADFAPEVNPAFSDRRSEQEQNRLDMSAREAAIRTAANAAAPEVKSYAADFAPEVNPAFSDRRSEQDHNRRDISVREAAIRMAGTAVPEVKEIVRQLPEINPAFADTDAFRGSATSRVEARNAAIERFEQSAQEEARRRMAERQAAQLAAAREQAQRQALAREQSADSDNSADDELPAGNLQIKQPVNIVSKSEPVFGEDFDRYNTLPYKFIKGAEKLFGEQASHENEPEQKDDGLDRYDRIEMERIRKARLELEQRRKEQQEAEQRRLAAEQAAREEAERRAAELEAQRLEAERKAAAEREEAERVENERRIAEQKAREDAERQRLAAEQAVREEAERRAAELEAQRLEAERKAAEQEKKERAESEQRRAAAAEIQRLADANAEVERIRADKSVAEQAEKRRIAAMEAERLIAAQVAARKQTSSADEDVPVAIPVTYADNRNVSDDDLENRRIEIKQAMEQRRENMLKTAREQAMKQEAAREEHKSRQAEKSADSVWSIENFEAIKRKSPANELTELVREMHSETNASEAVAAEPVKKEKKVKPEKINKPKKNKEMNNTKTQKSKIWLIIIIIVAVLLALAAGVFLITRNVFDYYRSGDKLLETSQPHSYTASSDSELVTLLTHPSLCEGDTITVNGDYTVDISESCDGFLSLGLINLDCSAGSLNFSNGVVLFQSGRDDSITFSGVTFTDCTVFVDAPNASLNAVLPDESNVNVKNLNGASHNVDLNMVVVGSKQTVPVTVTNLTSSGVDAELQLIGANFVFVDGDTMTVSLNGGETKTVDVPVVIKQGGHAQITAIAVDSAGNLIAEGKSDYIETVGGGYYAGDCHTHTVDDESIRFGTLQENVQYAYQHGMSFIYSVEKNDKTVLLSADEIAALTGAPQGSFLQLHAGEAGDNTKHYLIYGSDVEPNVDYNLFWNFQNSVDEAINGGGTLSYAHPFSFGSLEANRNALFYTAGFTSMEILDNRLTSDYMEHKVTINAWNNVNVYGWKLFGLAGSNNVYSEEVGTRYVKGQASSLSEQGIFEMIQSGNYYCSNGPDLRFTLGGADMGEYISSTGDTATTAYIYAADDEPLTTVQLIKYEITGFIEDLEPQYIVDLDLTGQNVYCYSDIVPVTVNPNEYYRLEVHSEKAEYYEDIGMAFSNPIWVYSSMTGMADSPAGVTVSYEENSVGGELGIKLAELISGESFTGTELVKTTANDLVIKEKGVFAINALSAVSDDGSTVSIDYHRYDSEYMADKVTVTVYAPDGFHRQVKTIYISD